MDKSSKPSSTATIHEKHEEDVIPPKAMLPPPDTHITEPTEPEPTEEVKVPALLLQGTPLLKVSAKKAQTRVFRLDPDQGQILWPSKKSGVRMCRHLSVTLAMCIDLLYSQ